MRISQHWAEVIRNSIKLGREHAATYGTRDGGYCPIVCWEYGISNKKFGIQLEAYTRSYEKALKARKAKMSLKEQKTLQGLAYYWSLSSGERKVWKKAQEQVLQPN